ncbi:MAG: ABC transporter substrate-binding protein [Oscillospiraceae bacterium]|nr:ABC transporter substrate-binding protein [Oscillospiraceae bacterium]
MKRAFCLVLALVLALGALTACGSSTPAPTASTAPEASNDEPAAEPTAEAASEPADEPAPELRELNVVLDWYPNALHTFLYTAIERGYFAEEGLDVKIRFPANDNDALSLVSAGRAEIGLFYEHDIIQAVANQGVKIKSIGAVVQSPLNVILSLKDKNILSPKDLVGKTVGYGGTALSEALVQTMVSAVGEDPASVNLINVGFELMSSMTTDNVDATIGCLVNHEVPQMEEEGFEVNYFLVNEYGIPNYYEAVFLASDSMIENEPEVLAGFLRACEKGFRDFQADPAGCLEILLNNQNEENFPLSPSVEAKSAETLLPLMETEGASFLTQTEENWQTNIDWMLASGLIDQAVPVSDVMANIEW